MSYQAVTWATRHAPITNSYEHSILACLAVYADENGEGAWPSIGTIMENTLLSRPTVRKYLKELARRGVIRRGDQRKVNHLPRRRRPVVWDLNLLATRHVRTSPEENPQGVARSERVVVGVGATPAPSRDTNPGGEKTPRRRFYRRSTGQWIGGEPSDADTRHDTAAEQGRRVVTHDEREAELPSNDPVREVEGFEEGNRGTFSREARLPQIVIKNNQRLFNPHSPLEGAGSDTTSSESTDPGESAAPVVEDPMERFDEFWEAYPRKAARGRARRAWKRAVRHTDSAVILEAVRRFAADPNLPEERWIPYPSTWLRDERWLEGALPARYATNTEEPRYTRTPMG